MRYLEDCIAKLKAHAPQVAPRAEEDGVGAAYNPGHNFSLAVEEHAHSESQSSDVEMAGSSQEPSPALTPSASRFQHPSISPTLLPENTGFHHRSDPSYSSYSQITSPAFGPQLHSSTLTSPVLPPQRDLDQEATAALLMLNQTDRRGSAARGMSVRDLLSS